MLLLTLFVIQGHSMEPTLRQGQSVLVSSIPFFIAKPKIGDIVVFRKDQKVFIKRISKVDGNKFFVCGDNEQDSFDSRVIGWVKKEDILGKVIFL